MTPARDRNPDASPDSPETLAEPNEADPFNLQSVEGENEAAKWLAELGFDVYQNPSKGGGPLAPEEMAARGLNGNKNPDYLINGEVFDAVTPNSANPYSIWSNIRKSKLADGQTRRIVINLSNSDVDPAALRKQFEDYPMTAEFNGKTVELEEVIFLANGRIVGRWAS